MSGRHKAQAAYNFKVQEICPGCFRLYWTVDFYYANSRLRWPRQFSRDTDRAGAVRFCKRHELPELHP